MLYDLSPDKVERFILLPYLEEIYNSNNEQEQYWRFLANGYRSFCYILLNKEITNKLSIDFLPRGRFYRDQDLLEPSCIVMFMILKILHESRYIRVKIDGEKFAYDELLEDKLYAEIVKDETEETKITSYALVSNRRNTNEKYVRRIFSDKLSRTTQCDTVMLGNVYSFDFSKGLTHRDEYTVLVDYWEAEDCPTRRLFMLVKDYYLELKERASEASLLDDDDF